MTRTRGKGKSNDCLEPEGRNVSGGCLEACCFQDWWLGLTPELVRPCMGLLAHDKLVLCGNKHKRGASGRVFLCLFCNEREREREREREIQRENTHTPHGEQQGFVALCSSTCKL